MTAQQLDEALAAQDANPVPKTNPRALSVPAIATVGGAVDGVIAHLGATPIRVTPEAPRALRFDPSIPRTYQGPPESVLARVAGKLHRAISGTNPSERFGGLFLGPSGCGKSSAGAWCLRRWRSVETKRRVDADPEGYPPALSARLHAPSVAWLDALEATDAERRYRLGSGDPADLAEAYRADWLVLDDVGLTCSATLVQLVLARRYQACLPTIVTTGLERGQLVQHIGAATVRRIVEFEGRAGVMIDCHGGGS